MSRSPLAPLLADANAHGYAVPGFVCLGWEDARAYAAAAEAERAPLILQAGPGCRAHTPLPVLAAMFGQLAEHASVPVVLHLDHGQTAEECRAALDLGFTSVMYDGSRLPLAENIARTAEVAALARAAGASSEGEIGFVGYAGGAQSAGTDPAEAARFAAETGVDAVAVSVGNVHLQEGEGAGLDMGRLRAIETATDAPLVIHGGSGLPVADRPVLAAQTRIAKVNMGTELRRVFGTALREALAAHPDAYDRVEILSRTEPALEQAARAILRQFGAAGRA